MNEIPELKEDEYENIENSIIDSFDTETNNNEAGSIKDIEDVTLNDIVEINSNDDNNEDI
jgi:hypothetical protein